MYADWTDIKSAGAHIQEEAMVNPPRIQPTFLLASKNPSFVCHPCHLEKMYVINVVTTAKTRRNQYPVA